MTAFTVNVPGPAIIRTVCKYSRQIRFLSRVSYLPSDPTFFYGGVVALLPESYTFVQRNSHVFLALSDQAYVSGAR